MKKLTGRCLCEAISYEISGELGPIYNCHCSKCRRWHGAMFRTRSAVEVKKFKWLSGEEYLAKYTLNNTTRTFCSICGSNLISYFKNNPEYIGMPLGGLEQDPGARPLGNIFVASKSPWYEIADGLPQYDEWPPGGSKAVTGKK
jgi:hypothetical protein